MNIYEILPEKEAVEIAKKVSLLKDWDQGKARTKELTGTTKQNEEILSHSTLHDIGKLIAANSEFQLDCIPLKMHPPKYSRYKKGQHYKLHTDAPWMGQTRTDLSCTLFLSRDYKGGELVIDGKSYKGRPGEAIIYECGLPHEVLPVTEGERICVITWIQSRIRDPHKRKIVSDMRKFLANFEDDQKMFVQGGRIHSALLRMWIES